MMIGVNFGGFYISVQAEDRKGALLALSCTSCHGTHGLSPGAMPTLYGKSLEYLEQTMQEYKSDKRPATMMHRIAKGYTLEEIRLISKYFASLYEEKSIQ
jgi:sulfide dehydrogenase cytochrome subunit